MLQFLKRLRQGIKALFEVERCPKCAGKKEAIITPAGPFGPLKHTIIPFCPACDGEPFAGPQQREN